MSAERLLFITLSNIGDVVLTTPVLERLHACYPNARIDIVADARSALLLQPCPYRGEIFLKHKNAGVRGLLQLVRQLRRTRYDVIVDLRTDGLTALLRGREKLTKRRATPLGPHSVQQHMGVIATRYGADIPPCRVWWEASHAARAQTLLQTLPSGPRLALGPGANWPPKVWPAARFVELIHAVQQRLPLSSLVLLGGTGDQARCAEVAAGAAGLPCVNLSGQTDLLVAAAVLQQCTAFVGNDSGLGHIAAAVGLPTVTVFGPGNPPRYHPWGLHSHWLRSADEDIAHLEAAPVAAALMEMLRDIPEI